MLGASTMQTRPRASSDAEMISQTLDVVTTQPHTNPHARRLTFDAAVALTPLALGAGVAALTRSRRASTIAGAVSLGALAVLRWQLARWFTHQPAYVVEDRIGELEIRYYAPRIEAHTRLGTLDFETALDEGYHRLAAYLRGDNAAGEVLAMTTPVTNMPRARTHSVAFVMPPDRTLLSLPLPTDPRVSLVTIPECRIAALRFHGRYTGATMLEQTRRLHERVAAADLDPRGQPIFAAYDPPTTLPWLRRAEIWIALA